MIPLEELPNLKSIRKSSKTPKKSLGNVILNLNSNKTETKSTIPSQRTAFDESGLRRIVKSTMITASKKKELKR
jgi:hypothetical protein